MTLYWLTGTGASAARSYWENGRAAVLAGGEAPPDVSLPVGFTTFPDEIFAVPRSWVEASYPHVSYFNKVDREGHFAACEEPELFSSKVRARVQLTPLIATTTRGRAGRAQIWFDRHASEMRGGSI